MKQTTRIIMFFTGRMTKSLSMFIDLVSWRQTSQMKQNHISYLTLKLTLTLGTGYEATFLKIGTPLQI